MPESIHSEIDEIGTDQSKSKQGREKRALARQPSLCYDTKDPGLWARDLLIGKDLEVL